MTDDRLAAYAELAVRVGANVAPGQDVEINAFVEHAEFARAVAHAAYEAGARYVEVLYGDKRVMRSRIELAPEDALGWSPPWLVKRIEDLGEQQGAVISIAGDPEPDLFDDLEPRRVAVSRMKDLQGTYLRTVTGGAVNWTVVGYPTRGWAEKVLGEPDVGRLWELVARCVRLDEADPISAWERHIDCLEERAKTLTARRLDSVRFRGPGTDITIGLLPASVWRSAKGKKSLGQEFVANMPTEEVFTTTDPTRTEGTVLATRDFVLQGTMMRGFELRFD